MQTKFSAEYLSKLKLVPNRVLIKASMEQHGIRITDDLQIKIDVRYAQEKHALTTGTVVNVCGELDHARMPWHTKNDIKVGDYAVYSWESAMYCMDESYGRTFFDEKNNLYILIDYEDIFTVRRNDTIIPVNGYILVSPITEEPFTSFALTPDLSRKKSIRYGRVEYVSDRNQCYYAAGKIRKDVYDFKEEVKVGDTICFEPNSDLPVEYEIHHTLKKELFRMHRKDLYLIL